MQAFEFIEISLTVSPSFSSPLWINLSKEKIVVEGNIMLSKYPFGDNVERRELAISEQEFMKLIDDLASANIPPIAEFSMGLDGTTYSIAFLDYFNGSQYTWWEECPKEWQVLGKFAENLLHFVKIKIAY